MQVSIHVAYLDGVYEGYSKRLQDKITYMFSKDCPGD